ncbi:NUDIX hydrolase [Galactobacter valiniphilus]|uniref:NUDIX hydrolase n=1 Tax=Galactobacter valiniphilus TaxID=2676122 RepID=UPI0037366C95
MPGASPTAPVCAISTEPPATGVLRRLFPVPASRLDAARTWLQLGARTPRRAREASSVLLVRDAPDGVRAWLGLRGPESPLGMISFAGGSCSVDDDAQLPWFGPTPAKWAAVLGMNDHMLARRHVLAAIRELFEETGVLLAGPDPLSLIEDNQGEDWMRARQALASAEFTFAEFLQRRGWGVRTDLLRPVGHWISPDYELRRFDTYYFAAAAPAGQEVSPLKGKDRWGRWVSAKEDGARPESEALGDEIGQPDTVGQPLAELATPATQVMLEKLRRTRGCVAYLSSKRHIQAFQPELVEVEDHLLLDVTTVDAAEGSAVARGR